MAVDTRNKRAASAGMVLGFLLGNGLPLADGAIGQADRQQTAWTYPGILASAPAVSTGGRAQIGMVFSPGAQLGKVLSLGGQVGMIYSPGAQLGKAN